VKKLLPSLVVAVTVIAGVTAVLLRMGSPFAVLALGWASSSPARSSSQRSGLSMRPEVTTSPEATTTSARTAMSGAAGAVATPAARGAESARVSYRPFTA